MTSLSTSLVGPKCWPRVVFHITRWALTPGTELLGHFANIYYYKIDDNAKEVLKKYANSLYEWLSPNLPEDLCFFKENKEVWLASIAHEKDSWFNYLSEEEKEQLYGIGLVLQV